MVEVLRRFAPSPQNIFEIGCGDGSTARMLAGLGYSVTGVDPSSSGIELAKKYESAQLRFECGSTADDLAGRYGAFPMVISLEVIEHCPSSREFIRAFRSVLQPGGLGIFSTPYHGYLKNLALVASGNFDRHFDPLWEGGHLKFFTLAKLRELLNEAGFARYEFKRIGRISTFAKTTMVTVHG